MLGYRSVPDLLVINDSGKEGQAYDPKSGWGYGKLSRSSRHHKVDRNYWRKVLFLKIYAVSAIWRLAPFDYMVGTDDTSLNEPYPEAHRNFWKRAFTSGIEWNTVSCLRFMLNDQCHRISGKGLVTAGWRPHTLSFLCKVTYDFWQCWRSDMDQMWWGRGNPLQYILQYKNLSPQVVALFHLQIVECNVQYWFRHAW